jgi:phosphate/sulfate permease
VYTPAIGGVFIAGFLAPRASWLLGIVVGLVAATCFSIVILGFPLQIYPTAPTTDEATAAVGGAFVLSPVMGALFASAAAWYRRFLALSSPNRGRQAAATNRPTGKSRAANARR